MTNFYVLTIFPELFTDFVRTSIVGIAAGRNAVRIHLVDIREYTTDKHRSVDDRPYGGGPGMLMKAEPVILCVEDVIRRNHLESYRIVLLSPQGKRYSQQDAVGLKSEENIIFICGRYEGFDERIRVLLGPGEFSIGDYVLSGGEVPAMVIMESVTRLLPGVLGSEESLVNESFSHSRLEPPQYTRPEIFRGEKVPEVLLSGNHKKIEEWRQNQSIQRTMKRRKDLLGAL